MPKELPKFKYYPTACAPAGTDVVAKEAGDCPVCGEESEYVYMGPVYAEDDDLEESICPWCIANGSAHRQFEAEFNPVAGSAPDTVPSSIVEEIAYRTPGITAWQEAQWFFHCNDGAVYLGPVGISELKQYGEDAVEAIREEASEVQADEGSLDDWMNGLSKTGSPTAYLFQCQHCKAFGGFSDCD
jgi:uncharacterized protein CbrC (UPF0167 family)